MSRTPVAPSLFATPAAAYICAEPGLKGRSGQFFPAPR